MKPHQNRHHLTQGQTIRTRPLGLAGTDRQQEWFGDGQTTAKIIQITEDSYDIPTEL
jgi:hypothetical protein